MKKEINIEGKEFLKISKKKWYQQNKGRLKTIRDLPKNKLRKKEYDKEYQKKYYQENKEKLRASSKLYNQREGVKFRRKRNRKKPENKLKRKEYLRKYRKRPESKVKINVNQKKYRQNPVVRERARFMRKIHDSKPENKLRINKREKKRNAIDKNYNLKNRLRSRLYKSLKQYTKTGKVMPSDEYGVNYEAIIKHLEPFPKNVQDYEVDHIIPLSKFDLTNPEQIKKAFVSENHQWLTKEINMWKGNRLIKPLTNEEKEKLQKELEKESK